MSGLRSKSTFCIEGEFAPKCGCAAVLRSSCSRSTRYADGPSTDRHYSTAQVWGEPKKLASVGIPSLTAWPGVPPAAPLPVPDPSDGEPPGDAEPAWLSTAGRTP